MSSAFHVWYDNAKAQGKAKRIAKWAAARFAYRAQVAAFSHWYEKQTLSAHTLGVYSTKYSEGLYIVRLR
jgi:hypothetical protein